MGFWDKTKDFAKARERMVHEQLIPRGIRDPRVLKAMGKVPRHFFMDEALWSKAYEDYPLPIGEKQTISQPYIVALMTEALGVLSHHRILELGTGSGYQTAILGELCYKVYSIERFPSLLVQARKALEKLNVLKVVTRVGDGTYGWPDEAPFDGIIITAGAPSVPEPILDQLIPGGRLVIPVGDRISQSLKRITRTESGIKEEDLGGVRFVSLVGNHGWKE
jgi:protein-L-isoaspartate(D-aspartate) O-methyltransferase